MTKHLAIFLATSGHSGVDRIMKNLIPAIAAKGIRVDLLHIRNHGVYLDEIPANVRVVELGTAHTYTSLIPLIRYLKQQRPDVLLSDKDRVNRVSLWAKRLAGVPARVVVRNGTTVSKDLAGRDALDRWLHYISMHYWYPRADAIIVPSQGAADDMARFAKLPDGRITVVRSPLVTEKIIQDAKSSPDHPWFTNKSVPVILGVGELSKQKGFDTLIQAFAIVRKTRRCKLVLLGKGRGRPMLESLVQELNLADDVSLPGFVKNPFAYMMRADVFVLSSTYEGFGNVLVEALALGTPVVSTDCPSGPRETLQNGKYGRLVPVGDAAAMAQAISDTLDHPMASDMLKEAARPFYLDTSCNRYLEVLGLKDDA